MERGLPAKSQDMDLDVTVLDLAIHQNQLLVIRK